MYLEWLFDHKTLSPTVDTDLLLREIQNSLATDTTRTPGHLVLLAHDQSFQKDEDIGKLHYLLQQLKINPGYRLILASQYPGVKQFKAVSSKVNSANPDRK